MSPVSGASRKRGNLALLVEATNAIAEAETPKQGLQHIADMMLQLLEACFCRILLIDEIGSSLVLKASATSRGLEGCQINDREPIRFVEWPGFERLLHENKWMLLRSSDPGFTRPLLRLSQRLKLPSSELSLLVIPLKAAGKVIGIIEAGDLIADASSLFAAKKVKPIETLAGQVAGQIDRIRLQESADHRRSLQRALDAKRFDLTETETYRLRRQIVRLAVELVGWTAAGMYEVRRRPTEELELTCWHGPGVEPTLKRLPYQIGLFGNVASTGKTILVPGFAISEDREPSLDQYNFQTVVALPLVLDEQVDSILFVADDTGYKLFADTDRDILEHFALRAGAALRTASLISTKDRVTESLKFLHAISDEIQQAKDLDRIIHIVLTAATAGYGLGLNRAVLFLLDKEGKNLVGRMGVGEFDEVDARREWENDQLHGLNTFQAYRALLSKNTELPSTAVGDWVKGLILPLTKADAGLFFDVLREGRDRIVRDDALRLLPPVYQNKFAPVSPVALVPLAVQASVIGLLAADNKFTQRTITKDDVEALLTLANTAAIVIENRRLFDLALEGRTKFQSLFEASNSLILPGDPDVALHEIAEMILTTADATSASVILIDDRERVSRIVSVGTKPYDPQTLVRPEGISIQVMRSGKARAFPDTLSQQNELNPQTFVEGAASALCLPLLVERRPIGVAWIHYRQGLDFSEIAVTAWQLYVNQAALAYDNVLHLKRVQDAKSAAKVVARVTALGDMKKTLTAIAEGTAQVLRCDAVVLYGFDAETRRFDYPPTVVGVKSPEQTARFPTLPADSLVHLMLSRNEPYIVDDVQTDRLFKDRRFAKEEEIQSCLAVPLSVGTSKVGVMFVNYRSLHKFDAVEQEDISLFADQAAVAIANAHLFETLRKKSSSLKALYRAAEAITGAPTLQRKEILTRILEEARKLPGDKVVLGAIQSYDAETRQLTLDGVWAREDVSKFTKDLGQTLRLSLAKPINGRIGVTGRAVLKQAAQLVRNVDQDPDYYRYNASTVSEIAVPLLVGNRVIGVLNLETDSSEGFDEDDRDTLKAMADLAVIAIQRVALQNENEMLNERFTGSLATVAHELRDPLQPALLLGELLRRELFGEMPKQYKEPLSRLVDKLREENALIENVLSVVRTQARRAKLDLRPASMRDLLTRLVNRFRSVAASKEVSLELRITDSDNLIIEMDRQAMDRAIANLVQNAIKFTPQGGAVTVSGTKTPSEICVVIEDTGIGIPPPEHHKVFERFYQSKRPLDYGTVGMGIGLSIAKEIVEGHKGTLLLVRSQPGAGSLFIASLPIVAQIRQPVRTG